MQQHVEKFLYHHGVLGMRWGHRKSGSSSSSKPTHASHPDALLSAHAETKLKTHGIHTLSNQELSALANRRNLESRVRSTSPKHKVLRGSRMVTKVLNSPEGQISMKIIKSQTGRRVAATAATAGILALRRAG